MATDTWRHEVVLARSLDTIHPHAVVLALYDNDVAPRYDPHKVDGSRADEHLEQTTRPTS